jgi:hypothetical protein
MNAPGKLTCRVAAILLLFLVSCSESPTHPDTPHPASPSVTAGWLSIVLTTPNQNDGVVQLSVSGAPIDSLELAGSGYASLGGGGGKLVVTGAVQSGVVARIWVPDLAAASRYHGSVEAAAARSTYQLQDVTQGYSVRVIR